MPCPDNFARFVIRSLKTSLVRANLPLYPSTGASIEGGFQTRPDISLFFLCVLCVPIALSTFEGCDQPAESDLANSCIENRLVHCWAMRYGFAMFSLAENPT
jgi:hypothetical protein